MEGFLIWSFSILVWFMVAQDGYRTWKRTCSRYGRSYVYISALGVWLWVTRDEYRQYQVGYIDWTDIEDVPKYFPSALHVHEVTAEQIKLSIVSEGKKISEAVMNADCDKVKEFWDGVQVNLPDPQRFSVGTVFHVGESSFMVTKQREGLHIWSQYMAEKPRQCFMIRDTFGLPEISFPVMLDAAGDPCDGLMHYVRDGEAKLIRNELKDGPFNGYAPKEYREHVFKQWIKTDERDFFNKWTRGEINVT